MPRFARQRWAPLFRQARRASVVGSGGTACGILTIGGTSFGLPAPTVADYAVQCICRFGTINLIPRVLLLIGSAMVMTLAHRPLGEPEPASLSASATMYRSRRRRDAVEIRGGGTSTCRLICPVSETSRLRGIEIIAGGSTGCGSSRGSPIACVCSRPRGARRVKRSGPMARHLTPTGNA